MPNRMISLERNTNETQIDLTLDLDGTGRYEVDSRFWQSVSENRPR